MKRVICILSALLLFGGLARAQVNLEEEFFSLPDSVTNSYLDDRRLRRCFRPVRIL